MNFSECFKQTGQLCKFSADGKYIANSVQYRVIIRDAKTLQIASLFTCLDSIDVLEWSSDSLFILCGNFKRALVQVWSIEHSDWTCKIDEGVAGLEALRWAPDGRHILSTSKFKLRITVWSLIDKTVSYIRYPKHTNQGLSFTKDGKFMALAERRNCKDFISIFSCGTWQLVKHFEADTNDLTDLAWSPDGRILAVWESCLEYNMLLYAMNGRIISSYSAYDFALGIKAVTWSPSSQFLVIASYDQSIRVLNNITWTAVTEFKHSSSIGDQNAVIYKEVQMKQVKLPWEAQAKGPLSSPSQYQIQQLPFSVPTVRADPEKANPKIGVGKVVFSHDNRYIASRNDNMPTVVWIWDVKKLSLSTVLVQSQNIQSMEWDPKETRLAICCGTNKLYMWSPAGCLSVDVPMEETFNITGLRWHKDGRELLLLSKNSFCMCSLALAS
ncbi:WD repeat-containing protein WRAP73-like [Rhopilema esculentum]|uniref:WD repeat-containing protein WRAP73-like n=1 Tax=Rhopilema esculentum TaxID=499914 RepID=UPI0031DE1076